jgi:hypothetical protein
LQNYTNWLDYDGLGDSTEGKASVNWRTDQWKLSNLSVREKEVDK